SPRTATARCETDASAKSSSPRPSRPVPPAQRKRRVPLSFRTPRHSRQNHKTGDNHVHDRQRQQQFPSERHQLVIAETRQRPAHPHIHKQKNKNLGQQPERRLNKLIHVWEQNKNSHQPGRHRSSSRQNK